MARVYKSLKGLSSRNVTLQQLWRCIYVSESEVRPCFQFGQVVFLCIFVYISNTDQAFSLDKLYLYLWWWYMFQRLGSGHASLKCRPSFQFGQVVFLCIFVSILYLRWWYIYLFQRPGLDWASLKCRASFQFGQVVFSFHSLQHNSSKSHVQVLFVLVSWHNNSS